MTITGTRGVTLGQAAREFWRHPTPWMILTLVVGAVAARIAVGGLALRDLWAPLVLALLFPFVEWVIHVFILHWRPRKLGRVTVDTLVARDHRRHHANPREIDLVFIPTPTLPWLIAAIVVLFAGTAGIAWQYRTLFGRDPGIALLVFFMFALQCMSTGGVLRRETGSWKWPAIAYGYMFVLAWVGGALARLVVERRRQPRALRLALRLHFIARQPRRLRTQRRCGRRYSFRPVGL